MSALLDWLRAFSLREVATARGRAVASVAVIAVSCALLVAVLGLISSIDNSIARLAEEPRATPHLRSAGLVTGVFPRRYNEMRSASPVFQWPFPSCKPLSRLLLGHATARR